MLHSYIHTHMCVFICTYTVYSMYMDAFTQPHINMSVCVYIYRKRETEREKRERERLRERNTTTPEKGEHTPTLRSKTYKILPAWVCSFEKSYFRIRKSYIVA